MMELRFLKIPHYATGFLALVVLSLPALSFAYRTDVADFKLSASVVETYDDNITLARDNVKSDTSTSLNLGLEAHKEGKNRYVSLAAAFAYQLFQSYSEFDNHSERLSATFSQEFSKYDRLTATNRFVHAEDPQSFEDEFGRASGRYSYYTNSFAVAYTHDFTAQTSLTARYANDIYDPSRGDLASSYGNRVSLEAGHAASSRLLASAGYDFFQRNFDPGTEATFHILSAGCRYYFTTQLYFNSRFGANFINSYNERDYAKPMANLALVNELDRQTTASLSYVKDYTANASTQDLFDYWQASASLSRQLLERLAMNANAFYGEGTYRSFTITDEFIGASVGASYEATSGVRLLLQYGYSQAESNVPGREYERTLVSAGLRAEF